MMIMTTLILSEGLDTLWVYVCPLIYATVAIVIYALRTLAPYSIYPPLYSCTNVGCYRTSRGLELKKAEQHQVILYTLDKGAISVWSVHLYCEGMGLIIYCYYCVALTFYMCFRLQD